MPAASEAMVSPSACVSVKAAAAVGDDGVASGITAAGVPAVVGGATE
jgi:hypothetical protein